MTFWKTLAAGAAAVGLIAGAGSALAADTTLKIAFLGSEDDEDYDGSLVLKNYVEAASNGALAVEIYPNGRFCSNADECSEALLDGRLDIYITTNGGLAGWYPPAQFLDLPYLFPSDRVAECVFDGPLTAKIRQAVLEDVGAARLMAVSNTGGWRNIATTSKQVKSPDDVKGLKLRTIGADIQIELVKALGGSPTPIAWPEVYTSLGTGVVEGTKNGITDIVNMKFQDHLKYISLDGHAYMGALWWMNEDIFQSLSADQQRIVYDGFQELKMTARVLPKRKAVDAFKAFTDAGGTIYSPTAEEKAAFQAAARPVWDWYEENFGAEWIEAAQSAVAACETSLEAEFKAAAE
ncbi:TRAP transporter substrate-binding protein DctP [Pelagibius sp.]|uniref:TRAP transporter substrate-binding protein n=1 Tax=Pelagibius sp. TaxID=1931238 RepID=UPI002610C318|nr:TRAP transporter substrate-binding protein DctP [Pelagibius sp.]